MKELLEKVEKLFVERLKEYDDHFFTVNKKTLKFVINSDAECTGQYDIKNNIILLKKECEEITNTLVHECLHMASANRGEKQSRIGFGIYDHMPDGTLRARGHALNEGMTELLTCRVLECKVRDGYLFEHSVAYVLDNYIFDRQLTYQFFRNGFSNEFVNEKVFPLLKNGEKDFTYIIGSLDAIHKLKYPNLTPELASKYVGIQSLLLDMYEKKGIYKKEQLDKLKILLSYNDDPKTFVGKVAELAGKDKVNELQERIEKLYP